MITEGDIREAYCFLREKNHTIPSEVLEFMLRASLERLRLELSAAEIQSLGTDLRHPTKEAVELAAIDNPALHQCLHCYREGIWTWEETMAAAALYLVRQNAELVKKLVDCRSRSCPLPP